MTDEERAEVEDRMPVVLGLPSREQRLRELARDLVNASYLRGDFVLSSGMRSSYYFDKYLFETKPGILRRVASFLAERLPAATERIAAPELGAVALGTAVSLETGVPFLIVKKHPKDHATQRTVEGELFPGERVVVIEDVLTAGAAALRAANQVAAVGGVVLKIVAVIDRGQGAAQRLASAGFECEALFTKDDLDV